MRWWFLIALLLLNPFARAADWQQMNFTVDGVARTARIYVPNAAKTNLAPLVFVFHGHGGNSRNAAAVFTLKRNGRKRSWFICKACRPLES